MRVCVYACMRVCVYACMRVCVYACMRVCMYACMRVCMYACMRVCVYVCMCLSLYLSVKKHYLSAWRVALEKAKYKNYTRPTFFWQLEERIFLLLKTFLISLSDLVFYLDSLDHLSLPFNDLNCLKITSKAGCF
jgi:hypothetical protein